MSVLFVTGFKDIGRERWPAYSRKQSLYVEKFCRMATAISQAGHRLIVYVEDEVRRQCAQYDPTVVTLPNVEFVDLLTLKTFLDKYMEVEQAIIDSPEFKAIVAPERSDIPGRNYASYNLINHSKVNMVADAKKKYPTYDYYVWTDFGCDDYPTKDLKISEICKEGKIVYALHTALPSQQIDPVALIRFPHPLVFFMGSQFVAHTKAVELYEMLYEEAIRAFQSRGLTEDDQNLVLQMYYKMPDLFQPIYLGQWFSMFKLLFNVTNQKS